MQELKNGRRGRSQGATSLVEVMVVLVVLLIGVFAVIRLFPAGFGFLRTGANKTQADRLSSGMMEQLKADAQNLPEQVTYAYIDPDTGQPVTVVSQDPDDLDARGDGDPYFSDVNKIRYIKGEAVKVGLPTPGQFGSGFVYMVKFGPVLMKPAYGDSAFGDPDSGAPNSESRFYLNVYSAPLVTSNDLADSQGGSLSPFLFRGALRSARNYVLDPGAGGTGAFFLVLPAAQERIFRLRYLTLTGDADDTSAQSASAREESLVVPANFFGWVPLTGVTANDRMAPGSEVVTRVFRRKAVGAAFSPDDPYEFKLVSANIPGGTGTPSQANLGILSFNPAGATFTEDTSNGPRAFVAYVDYPVLDWHIIHDDREVPSVFADSAGAVPLRLTLTRLKRSGDVGSDNTLFDGIFPSVDTDPAANRDMVVVRMDSGAELTGGDYDLRGTTDANAAFWTRSSQGGTWDTGTIYVNTNQVPAGTPLRILYKGDNDWGVSLQKAASTYRAWQVSQVGRPPFASTDGTVQFGDPATFGLEGTRIYFTRSELNKAVVLRLQYVDGNGARTRTAPLQISIDTAEGEYAYVDVARHLPTNLSRWQVVDGRIQGVSVKVRVVWRDHNNARSPWQVQDLDSYITQETPR